MDSYGKMIVSLVEDIEKEATIAQKIELLRILVDLMKAEN